MVIQHNLQSSFASGQVNETNRSLSKNTEKLSTGYRINRAADDAAGLKISEKMRWQIRGLNQASENIQDGNSLTNVADGALHEIHGILQRQRELLVQAANDTNTTADRQAIEDELTSLSRESDRIFNDTEYNTIKIFQGLDTYLLGPTLTTTPTTLSENTVHGTPNISSSTVWLPRNPAPDLNPPDIVNQTSSSTSSTDYFESETVVNTDELGHSSFEVKETYRTTTSSVTTTNTTHTEYTPITNDSTYTDLKPPGDMVGNDGYINVKNVKGDLDLSCAMSQLGVKMDGTVLTFDLYNTRSIPRTTTISQNKLTATTKYDLGDGVSLTQEITLVNNNQYNISYRIDNTGPNNHTVDVRLAFDTMNTPATSVNDGTTTDFTLQSNVADIGIGATDADKGVLGDIGDLYNTWSDQGVVNGSSISNHTGVGYWWNDNAAGPGSSATIGSVGYGPITLKADPYLRTITKTTDVTTKLEQVDVTNGYTYEPTYLDIQASSLAYQNIPVRLYHLTSATLRLRVPNEMSAFNAGKSLDNVDRVIGRISSIRSYYGAISNRFEHAHSNVTNTSENSQAAESRLRDTDMAEEMVEYSKNNILLQTGQSLLAQSNHNFDQVMSLLQ